MLALKQNHKKKPWFVNLGLASSPISDPADRHIIQPVHLPRCISIKKKQGKSAQAICDIPQLELCKHRWVGGSVIDLLLYPGTEKRGEFVSQPGDLITRCD